MNNCVINLSVSNFADNGVSTAFDALATAIKTGLLNAGYKLDSVAIGNLNITALPPAPVSTG